jgi:hypothetical protein
LQIEPILKFSISNNGFYGVHSDLILLFPLLAPHWLHELKCRVQQLLFIAARWFKSQQFWQSRSTQHKNWKHD